MKKNNFRRLVAVAVLGATVTIGGVSYASAQTSTTSANTKAKPSATTDQANRTRGNGDRRGGGFNVHSDTIAKALGITTAELQTQLQAGKTVAQIASAKGVNVQTVIDAYVAEEVAEHPEMAKADIVKRVTDRLNGVKPTRPTNSTTSSQSTTGVKA